MLRQRLTTLRTLIILLQNQNFGVYATGKPGSAHGLTHRRTVRISKSNQRWPGAGKPGRQRPGALGRTQNSLGAFNQTITLLLMQTVVKRRSKKL